MPCPSFLSQAGVDPDFYLIERCDDDRFIASLADARGADESVAFLDDDDMPLSFD